MNIIPTILEKTNNECIAYDLYSRLLEDRIIFLSGEINDQLANLIISELLYLDSKNHDEINLYINSPGGSISSGMAIYDTMNYIKSDMKIACERIIKIKEKLNKILSKNTGQPLEKITLDTDRDYYMSSKEAKDYGLIDEII